MSGAVRNKRNIRIKLIFNWLHYEKRSRQIRKKVSRIEGKYLFRSFFVLFSYSKLLTLRLFRSFRLFRTAWC